MFRPDNPLLPNYKYVPIGYHGRASSIVASGTDFHRPLGQTRGAGDEKPGFGPSRRLDYELELGAVIGQGNALGHPIAMQQAEDHLFGLVLLNDWSARDVQAWEYQPLGPFLAKNFATTISPWVVTMEALAPFRVPGRGRTADQPDIPTYLNDPFDRASGGLNVELTAEIDTGSGPATIVRTNAAELFWTLAQMVAHQASGGAPLETGDLIATGTVSGAADEARACLVEITRLGQEPLTLPDGTKRVMLEDGDTLTLRGRATAEGYVPIGFGPCSGTIMPAKAAA
jgi:fumarylacetoacetase